MTKQSLLFDPDLEPIRYIAQNGTFELTFDGQFRTFWLSQKQIGELFNLTQSTISEHIANFKRDRPNESVYRNFRIVQTEGNRQVAREIEHYNHSVVIYIGYRAQATAYTIAFQRFVEEIVRQRLETEHQRAIKKAQHGHAVKVTGYVLAGKTQSHAEKRVETMSTFKELTAAIVRISEPRLISQVVSTEYITLFGKIARDLKAILHADNIRDALPELQLSYVEMAERTLVLVLAQKDKITPEELLKTVVMTVKPLADHLRMICETIGIDIVTGQKLLGGGK